MVPDAAAPPVCIMPSEATPSGSGDEGAAAAAPIEKAGPSGFTFYDVFFWRDAPDWYRKTFISAGFGFTYCVLKQYLNRHELEVFMPPRSKILPQTMQEGYRNSQMLKYGFLKVGGEVTTIAGAAATYYAGAYYLGRYRDVHSWENFAASGAGAGLGVALWLIRPLKVRPLAFGMLLGGALGGAGAYVQQVTGQPFWDETHDFEGWFLGSRINLKKAADSEEDLAAQPAGLSGAAAKEKSASASSSPSAAPGTSGKGSAGGAPATSLPSQDGGGARASSAGTAGGGAPREALSGGATPMGSDGASSQAGSWRWPWQGR